MNGRRVARHASVALVAGIAAWASYSHMVSVALRFGERPEVAYLLPISVDGMLIVSTVVMADDRLAGRPARPWARVAFVIGVAASIAANVMAAQPNGVARIVAAWPALALLLVVETLRSGRLAPSLAPLSPRPAAANAPDRTPSAPADKTPPTRRPSGRPSAAVKVATVAARMPDAAPGEIAAKAGVSTRTARRHLAATAVDKTPDPTSVNGAAVPDLTTTT